MRANHRYLLLPLAAAALLSACGNHDVLAKVGGEKLRKVDLDAFQGNGRSRGDARAALEGLAQRALLAEAGRKAGVDDDPVIRARIRAAVREIMAQAFVENELATTGREDLLRKRYAETKEKLARKQVHVAQIAVHLAGKDARALSDAQSKVSRIYSRVVSGEPFDKVAGETSDDQVSASRGGDLGILLEGQVDPTFFAEAAALKAGQVSRPFQTGFGYHLVKALEEPTLFTPTFDEVRGVLAAEARTSAEQALMERLRGRISVELHPERLAQPASAPTATGGR